MGSVMAKLMSVVKTPKSTVMGLLRRLVLSKVGDDRCR